MTIQWTHQWWASAPSPTHPERNEDGWWIAASRQAVAVIDGMGGYRRQTAEGEIGGEHAAAVTMRVLAEQLDNWDASLTLAESKAILRAACETINRAIWEELNHGGAVPAEENRFNKPLEELTVGVALSIIALCDNGTRALSAQHGDTHGYILSDELGLVQITEDQDRLLWDKMNGLVTEEEAAEIGAAIDEFDGVTIESVPDQRVLRYFYDKNIFGALGVDSVCPATGWSAIKLQPRNRLVLLSDGAYANCSLNELHGLAWLEEDPAAAIVDLAVQRGVLPRLPDARNPDLPYNMRSTQDDMTAIVVVVDDSNALLEPQEEAQAAAPTDDTPPTEEPPAAEPPAPPADRETDQGEIPTEPLPTDPAGDEPLPESAPDPAGEPEPVTDPAGGPLPEPAADPAGEPLPADDPEPAADPASEPLPAGDPDSPRDELLPLSETVRARHVGGNLLSVLLADITP